MRRNYAVRSVCLNYPKGNVLNDERRKMGNLNMQRVYFPEISGTQRKSIIEAKQVLSKYEHSAEFLSHFAQRASGGEIPASLARRQDGSFETSRGEGEEAFDIFMPRKRSNFLILARTAWVFRTTNARPE